MDLSFFMERFQIGTKCLLVLMLSFTALAWMLRWDASSVCFDASGSFLGLLVRFFLSVLIQGNIVSLLFNAVSLVFFGISIEPHAGSALFIGLVATEWVLQRLVVSLFAMVIPYFSCSLGMGEVLFALWTVYFGLLPPVPYEVCALQFKPLWTPPLFLVFLLVLNGFSVSIFLNFLVSMGCGYATLLFAPVVFVDRLRIPEEGTTLV